MHIRKLELHGFKSFPNRTTFHFSRGISGVVGPNGCGKSNVVDAVKWCLGEQRPKSLRGSAMQDVIFSGSESRNPMGLAEVTLHFDADDEPFPGEWSHHSELSITRKLFRTGDSEYRINGQKCRLRDIQELFMDSGAANRLYSFIEQGRIGEIVNARPEQRRTLIEEAAGISRYKARRKEAEQRLGSTLDNLEQVSALTANLSSRMRKLERQVAKAMKYRRLRSYIRQGEIFLGVSRYAGLTGDRRALTDQLRAAEKEEQALQRDVQRRDEGLRAGREQVEVLDTLVASLRDQLAELEASRRESEKAREYQSKEQTELEARKVELASQQSEAQEAHEAAAVRLDEAGRQRKEAEDRVAAIETELEKSRSTVQDAEAAVRRRRDEIESRKRAVMERVRSLARKQAELEAAAKRIEELKAQQQRLSGEEGSSRTGLAELEAQQADLEEAVSSDADAAAAARAAGAQADQAVVSATALKKESADAAKAASRALQAAEREEARVRTRLEGLEAMQSEHVGVEDGVKAALAVTGTLGTLAESLDVSEALEPQLVAALGEDLDAVLVPDAAVAAAVAASAEGRVRAIVVPEHAPSLEGVFADLKGTPAALAAVATVLGAVDSQPSVETALAHARDTGRRCLVDGEAVLVEPSGRMLLGRPGTAGTAALARRREIASLSKALTAAEASTASARSADTEAGQGSEAALASLEAARQQAAGARDAVLRADLALTDRRRQLAEVQREIKRETDRASRVAAERARADKAVLETEGTVAALREEINRTGAEQDNLEQELQGEQQTLQVDLGALNRARDGLNARAAEAAGLRERMVGLQRTEADVKAARDAAARQAERAQRERDAATARIAALVEDEVRLVGSLEEAAGQIAEVGQTLEARREEARAERESMRSGEEALTSVREKREAATQHRHELDRQLQEVKREVGAIRDELQEKHELSVTGLLDRVDRVGHVVVEVDPSARRDDLPEAAQPTDQDAAMLQDLRITADQLDEPEVVEGWKTELEASREALAKLGEVNLVAMVEYEEVSTEFNTIDVQRADLEESVASIRKTIARLNRISRERFRDTFDRVDACFQEIYPRLVGGGQAKLELTNEDDILETGVDITVQPPGKRLQNLSLLSGGETAMVAIALIFSLFRVKPSPFCLLDEVDAPLDEGNGARFNLMLGEMSELSQFIVVTHNKKTMEAADTLYGVTMDTPGVSRLVTVQLD